MKLKKIGAVLAGAALLGATLAGAAAQDVPPTEFFIDPETGQPNVVIVVGSGAAAMDVVSATMLAAKIGT
ncbi:MAG: S-layer protein, partial [Candidatus Methanofastidiosia archaeon]